MTVFEACLAATDHIWDDRSAYIHAVLELLGVDPDSGFIEGDSYQRVDAE